VSRGEAEILEQNVCSDCPFRSFGSYGQGATGNPMCGAIDKKQRSLSGVGFIDDGGWINEMEEI